jgi:hypothetical protein
LHVSGRDRVLGALRNEDIAGDENSNGGAERDYPAQAPLRIPLWIPLGVPA